VGGVQGVCRAMATRPVVDTAVSDFIVIEPREQLSPWLRLPTRLPKVASRTRKNAMKVWATRLAPKLDGTTGRAKSIAIGMTSWCTTTPP